MSQDQLIRWLLDSIDINDLHTAYNNGTTIAYFARVAQRFPAENTQPQRNTRPTERNLQTIPIQNAPIQDLNADNVRPPRYTPQNQDRSVQDRVRVSCL